MSDDRRWPAEAWIPLLAGVLWLWHGPEHGLAGFLFALLPGCLLLGSGVAMLLMPGDRRISNLTALGGLLGALFSLPAVFFVGPASALLLIAVSVAGFVTAGVHTIRLAARTDEAPEVHPTVGISAQVAVDEALIAFWQLTLPLPKRADHVRVERELADARALFDASGWLEKPADYHMAPPPVESPNLRQAKLGGLRYEHLSFESGYAPHPDEPGRERWLDQGPVRTAHAWVLRHGSEPRPWLVCIHGFQMGWPFMDLAAFPPSWLHRRLGLNLIVPTLPLHGLRKIGRLSGDGFLSLDILNVVHAVSQGLWDIRRMLGWVREQQAATGVGVMGYSLGGYHAALLACLDDDLDCVIAGIPLADVTWAIERHGPPLHLREAEASGLEAAAMRAVLRVVSPLILEPQIPRERRYLFAGAADPIVTPDQVRDLWRHWDRPRIEWYRGGHVTFRAHPSVIQLVDGAIRESLLEGRLRLHPSGLPPS